MLINLPSLSIGKVDATLFPKKLDGEIFICQVYVDGIIFGSSNEDSCKEFGELMLNEFEMSMIGELTFFIDFQVKQMREGIFISQEKYTRIFLRGSIWMNVSQSRHQCHLMDIST